MKKFLIILGVIIVLFIAAIIVLPIIFKDDIQQALDDTMEESINARVYYDVDKLSLSLIKNFPDITVSLGDFGIVGVEEFSEDTLVSVKKFEVTVDIMSAITGSQIKVEEILLDQPRILVLVLPDGKANYDIAKASEVEEETPATENPDSSESDVSIGIKKWTITDGKLVYMDQSLGFYTSLIGLNHEGSGDFTLDIFDLTTKTVINDVSLGYDGVEYVSNKRLEADVTLNMNLPEMQFTFKDNRIAVNQFVMAAEGNIQMPGDDINMDITFGGKDIDLKSILSLIPGVYQEYLAGVSASGEVNFDGVVKGTFNETTMPRVAANLSVSDGKISYAEYNIPMESINIQTNFDYPSADLKETSFNINQFSMLVDGEKLEAFLNFKNLEDYTWDFGFDGNADLEKITKIVPMEGMTLRGKINAGLKSSGKMSIVEAEQYDQLPTSGSMTIKDFFFQSEDLPQGFGISRANVTFNPSDIVLTQFDATSGKSDFSMNGRVTNYLAFALSENEVITGTLTLNSKLLDLNEFIPEEETEEVETPEDTTSLSVVKIPENIDFTFSSSIDLITFTNLEMKDFQGKVIVRDGAIVLEKNSFNMLDGTFELTGSYVTKDLDQPTYDLGFKIKDLSISKAFQSFETIKQYLPIAEQVTGNFSTEFAVNGLLGSDMMPLMDQINLQGLVNIAQATLNSGKFVSQLSQLTALKAGAKSADEEKAISVQDVLIKTEIKDGRLFVEPFDLNVKGQKATVGGSNTLDGILDYSMLLRDVPTGAIGSALNSAISSVTGGQNIISDKINLNIGITGTYDDPKVKLLGTSEGSATGSAKDAFKQQISAKVDEQKAKVEAEIDKKKEETEAKVREAAESAKESLDAKKKATQDSIKAAVDAEKKKAEEEAKKKVKNLFKKGGG